jgi:hypothetical protein
VTRLLAFSACLLAGGLKGGTQAPAGPPRIAPPEIQVGAFYRGADVTITGEVAAGAGAIVAITGPDLDERFNRKVRLGPIWVSGGRLHVSGSPSLLLRFSSAPVAGLLSRETIDRLRLDSASVQARIRIDPPARDGRGDAELRRDYLALKRGAGAYRFEDSGIVMGEGAECVPLTLRFRWPKKAPPGTYEVRLYETRDGSVVRQSSAQFPVVRTGFPAWLAGMAEDRASLYGITAVVAGTLAGFGIDFLTTLLFGKKKRAAAH